MFSVVRVAQSLVFCVVFVDYMFEVRVRKSCMINKR